MTLFCDAAFVQTLQHVNIVGPSLSSQAFLINQSLTQPVCPMMRLLKSGIQFATYVAVTRIDNPPTENVYGFHSLSVSARAED